MSNTLHYTLEELLDELNGYGLLITDREELQETLKSMGFDLDTDVETFELEEDYKMKKMFVDVTFRIVLRVNDDEASLAKIMEELEYNFEYPVSTGYNGVVIEESYIDNYELV